MSKLHQAIERYATAETSRKAAAAKGAITRLVKDLALELGVVATRNEVVKALEPFPDLNWTRQRFTPGSLYQEGEHIFGWWEEGEVQLMAEQLPIARSQNSYLVSFWDCKDVNLWQQRGFHTAEPLPIEFWPDGLRVRFEDKKTPIFLEHGYALPCLLQWMWEPGKEYLVTRSIISSGFWQAWKWWPDAQWWYLNKRPELFSDLDWWGEDAPPPRFEPDDDPYAAVLGGQG